MEKEKAEIASLVEKYGRVQSLMNYVNEDTLKVSYSKQPKGKAVGADGVTKEEYGKRLEENIENLIVRMKKFSYKPYPVRRAYIPKGNGKCEDWESRHLKTKWFRVFSRKYLKRYMSRSSKSFPTVFVQIRAVTTQSRG